VSPVHSAHAVCLLLFVTLVAPSVEAGGGRPAASWLSTLQPRVEEAAKNFDGELSLYVLDVESGEAYGYDADTPTYLSSAIKLAVMLEVLHQVDHQQLTWDERLEFGPDNIRDGMHRLGGTRPGERLSVATLLEYMMADSDNAAADLLIQRVGVERVQAQLAARGIQAGPVSSLLEERRRRNLAGEVFAVATSRAKAHLQAKVADEPELRRLLDEVQARELDPLSAVREILEKVYGIADDGRPHAR